MREEWGAGSSGGAEEGPGGPPPRPRLSHATRPFSCKSAHAFASPADVRPPPPRPRTRAGGGAAMHRIPNKTNHVGLGHSFLPMTRSPVP